MGALFTDQCFKTMVAGPASMGKKARMLTTKRSPWAENEKKLIQKGGKNAPSTGAKLVGWDDYSRESVVSEGENWGEGYKKCEWEGGPRFGFKSKKSEG